MRRTNSALTSVLAGLIAGLGIGRCAEAQLVAPAFSSSPSAPATLYLDFVGDNTTVWGDYSPGVTPAYSIDADTTTFSTQELANIQEIWSRVAEAYSPFNINVTTVAPAILADRQGMRVVIGGDGKNGAADYWTGQLSGGIAYVSAFSNAEPNTAYVFSSNLGNGTPKYVAIASAHEAGHTFGLYHQSTYDARGAQTAEYNPGMPDAAPIMGYGYKSTRALWWYGTSTSADTYQDDVAQISGPGNAFGYRPPDHATSLAAATPLSMVGDSVSASGVIETMFDGAYYSFATTGDGADVRFDVTGAPYGQMLDPSLALYSSDGTLLDLVATSSLSETLLATLPAGTYDIAVLSAGNYGDIGQYFLSGSIVPVPEPSVLIGTLATMLLSRRRGADRRAANEGEGLKPALRGL